MAVKKRFSEDEAYMLSDEELKIATRYLRRHKTAGCIPEIEAAKLFELFMVGTSFKELNREFPQYPIEQIIMTAAWRKWAKERDKLVFSLRDRVKAKVIKSALEQVDFITSMLSVANAENMADMKRYIEDPLNHPKPSLRIREIKEYRETLEMLQKLIASSTSGNKPKSLLEVLTDKTSPYIEDVTYNTPRLSSKYKPKKKKEAEAAADIIAAELSEVTPDEVTPDEVTPDEVTPDEVTPKEGE